MLKINLLPPYIYDKHKKVPWIIGSLAIIPLAALGMWLWFTKVQNDLAAATIEKDDATKQQNLYNQAKTAIDTEHANVANTNKKEVFVANSIKYNNAWP